MLSFLLFYIILVKCSPWFGGHHGLSLEFWRTLQKWAKLCFFLLARVHGTIIIQKNQVHQALFTLGDFFNVTLPSDEEKHWWGSNMIISFLAWQFKVISKLKLLNLTPHFLLQFCLSYIFCFAQRSCLWT